MKPIIPRLARALAPLVFAFCAHCGSAPDDGSMPTPPGTVRTACPAPHRGVPIAPPAASSTQPPHGGPEAHVAYSRGAGEQPGADSGHNAHESCAPWPEHPAEDAFDAEARWAPQRAPSPSQAPKTPLSAGPAQAPSPSALSAAARARWDLYCDLAAEPDFFATDTEVAALALALQRNIRVVASWPGPHGTTFTVSEFAGSPAGPAQGEALAVLLRHMHYEPLMPGAGRAPMPSNEALQSDMDALGSRAMAAELDGLARPVPGDGACFFHSIAALTGDTAPELRARAVAWMRTYGATQKVPSMAAWMDEQTLCDSYMPDKNSEAYRILWDFYPDL